MARQWIVVCLPMMDLVAEAIGPFRSEEKALAVVERIDRAYDEANKEINGAAQIVRLSTEDEFMREYLSVTPTESGENPHE